MTDASRMPDWFAAALRAPNAAEIIAFLEPLVTEARKRRLREVLSQRLGSVTVVMDAPHDPHNAAAVMRSCDAFGVYRLHVVRRNEPFRASGAVAKGTERWVEVQEHGSAGEAVTALAAGGYTLIGAHPDGALDPDDLRSVERLAIVMGNEHDGIQAQLLAACRRLVRIPMRGFVESLNVSVSAAVLLRAATRGRPGDLDARERQRLYLAALLHTVPRAELVLEASGLLPRRAASGASA